MRAGRRERARETVAAVGGDARRDVREERRSGRRRARGRGRVPQGKRWREHRAERIAIAKAREGADDDTGRGGGELEHGGGAPDARIDVRVAVAARRRRRKVGGDVFLHD